MHIAQKLQDNEKAGRVGYSFEFFPPKTSQGVQNLYDRMDRMHAMGPTFIDVTWGAGGRNSNLTCEMVKVAQNVYGLETCMHLTCTDMEKSKLDSALKEAHDAGCTNILALRGDPPREKEKWEATQGGFRYASDLVKYIKQEYGNHFDIAVAGYPEGCEDQTDPELLLDHLKEKCDAGASAIVTQMCYDADIFIDWIKKVRAKGIDQPILPGIMPIMNHAAFLRRAHWVKAHIPDEWNRQLDPVKNDDVAVREIGAKLVAEFCRRLLDAGIKHLHFYTMNLAQATRMVLEELDLIPSPESPVEKPLPWRPALGLKRREENVRPIFWRNRNRSYVERTRDWDEFPNGRWGDSRSPAFGELDTYGIGLKGTNEQNRKLWGEPKSYDDLAQLFVRYMKGEVESLPWSESPINDEANVLQDDLISLNSRGLLTINSQPPVNGAKSTHQVYGWGPRNGYVYQKAYLELFIHPSVYEQLLPRLEQNADLTFYAVTKSGHLNTNAPEGPNAVTWGVFPGKEIVQPTIVEAVSFLAWKDEFFKLGEDWAHCHDAGSPSRVLLEKAVNEWYLINIVNNDFQDPRGVFPLFDGIELQDREKAVELPPNGTTAVQNDGVNGHA